MRAQRGFTFALLAAAIAIIGIGLAMAGQTYSEAQRRVREQELLRVGAAFIQAIESYYESSPGTEKVYPRRLEDLLQDNRFAGTKRHLRRIYVDPITRDRSWGIERTPTGGIAGVFSLSDRAPLLTQDVLVAGQVLRAGSKYSDMKFVYRPPPGAPSKGR